MAEALDYERDLDPDLKWYDWADVLGNHHQCIEQITRALPCPHSAEDAVLRVLAVRRWLFDSSHPFKLMRGYDDEGCPALCPQGQPFLCVQIISEDMSARPQAIRRVEQDLCTTQPDIAKVQVAQWLESCADFDPDEMEYAHDERMKLWTQRLHEAETQWFLRDHSGIMAVVVVEDDVGDTVGVWDCMSEVIALPPSHRQALISSGHGAAHSIIARTLQDAHPHVEFKMSYSMTLHYAMPSTARRAELDARALHKDTPHTPSLPRARL